VGQVAYKLKLPASIKVHPVFHVSLLTAYRSDGRVQPPPPLITVDGDLEYEIERILSHRDRKYGQRVRKEYLIQWLGYDGPEHNSWETEKALLTNAKEVLQKYLDAVNSSSAEGVGASSGSVERTGPGREKGSGLLVMMTRRFTFSYTMWIWCWLMGLAHGWALDVQKHWMLL
jgi:hypothetical protein